MTRIEWVENGEARSAVWRSESGWPAPKKVVAADDTMSADAAYRLALDGSSTRASAGAAPRPARPRPRRSKPSTATA